MLASSKYRKEIAVVITQRLISAGSHWIKLGRWLSEGIRRPTQYPSSNFISTEEKPWNEETLKLNF